MATLTKVRTKSGIKWKALVRRGNRSVSKTFQLKSSAKAWAAQMERGEELAIALGSPGASITLAELAKEYLAQYAGRDHSRKWRVGFWVERIGDKRLTNIKPGLIKQHLDAYSDGNVRTYAGIGPDCKPKTRELDRKRKPASRNRMKAALGALLHYAKEKQYIRGALPTADVPYVPEDNKRVRFLSPDERQRLLKAVRGSKHERLYLLVIMALTSGCRLGELINLQWKDVDFDDKSIYLQRTKNEDPRVVPLAKPALAELKKYRGIGEALVFPAEQRTNRPFSFRRYWDAALKEAEIEDFHFHDCRHDVGSTLAMQGYSLLEIGEILGHRSAQTTKRYAHLSTDHKRSIIAEVFDNMEGNGDEN